MNTQELKKRAENIGNEAQEAAEACDTLCRDIESVESYGDHEEWVETVRDQGNEVISTLDLLAESVTTARDAIAAALTDREVAAS